MLSIVRKYTNALFRVYCAKNALLLLLSHLNLDGEQKKPTTWSGFPVFIDAKVV